MVFPKAASEAIQHFQELLPTDAGVNERKMFGQPVAFVNGNMFLGVFGENLFVRLSEKDRAEAINRLGCVLFEPMPGRAMKEYVVLPKVILQKRTESKKWVKRSLAYATTLSTKARKH